MMMTTLLDAGRQWMTTWQRLSDIGSIQRACVTVTYAWLMSAFAVINDDDDNDNESDDEVMMKMDDD